MTSPAKPPVSAAKEGDLMLGAIVRSVVDAAAAFGGLERSALLARIGLRPEELEDPDGLVAFESYVAAWEAIADAPGNEDLGLRLGAMSSPEFLGALGYAMVHAENALAAIRMFDRFSQLVSDTLAPRIEVGDDEVVYRLVWPARIARIPQFADAAVAGQVGLLRALTGLPKSVPFLTEVWYQCPRPAGVDRAEALGCRVRYGAPEARSVVRREPLERPLPRHDPALFAYLERHARAVLASVPEGGGVPDRVRRFITEGLRDGEPAQAEIARKLAMSERTLQRRLRESGTSFAAILDAVRQQLSQLYLSEPTVAVHEVAFLLGYSEPSAFHRAFRRWTGVTPQEFRKQSAI